MKSGLLLAQQAGWIDKLKASVHSLPGSLAPEVFYSAMSRIDGAGDLELLRERMIDYVGLADEQDFRSIPKLPVKHQFPQHPSWAVEKHIAGESGENGQTSSASTRVTGSQCCAVLALMKLLEAVEADETLTGEDRTLSLVSLVGQAGVLASWAALRPEIRHVKHKIKQKSGEGVSKAASLKKTHNMAVIVSFYKAHGPFNSVEQAANAFSDSPDSKQVSIEFKMVKLYLGEYLRGLVRDFYTQHGPFPSLDAAMTFIASMPMDQRPSVGIKTLRNYLRKLVTSGKV